MHRRVEQWAKAPAGIAVTYSDELPFEWWELPAHRAELCDYCFFWGPTRSVPLPQEDWFIAELSWPVLVTAAEGDPEGTASNTALGPPDTMTRRFEPGVSATYTDFRPAPRLDVSGLLAADAVTGGDPVDAARIHRGGLVLAFSRDGTTPASGGGLRSCDWTFDDGSTSFDVHWDGRAGAVRDPHVVATGTVRGLAYAEFFGLSTDDFVPGGIGVDEVIAYLLVDVSELQVEGPVVNVTIRGADPSGDGTDAVPAVDAIALIE